MLEVCRRSATAERRLYNLRAEAKVQARLQYFRDRTKKYRNSKIFLSERRKWRIKSKILPFCNKESHFIFGKTGV